LTRCAEGRLWRTGRYRRCDPLLARSLAASLTAHLLPALAVRGCQSDRDTYTLPQAGHSEDRHRNGDEDGSAGGKYRAQPAFACAQPAGHGGPQGHRDRGDGRQHRRDGGQQDRLDGRDCRPQIGQAGPQVGEGGSQPAKEQAEAVRGPLVRDPAADPLQAVLGGHDAVCGRVQRTAQALAVVWFRFGHDSCSSTLRSAAMPRAV